MAGKAPAAAAVCLAVGVGIDGGGLWVRAVN